MSHVAHFPVDDNTRPDGEVVHMIRKQIERNRERINRADTAREANRQLRRALDTIRPDLAIGAAE